MQQTLLQASEIIKFVSIASTFPPCDLKNIVKIEIKEFRDCLGSEFYKYLKSNLVDYSAAVNFESSTTYNEGDVVIYKGFLYKALEATNEIPVNCEKWVLAPKFNSDCLELLWCDYLGEYLSWCILKNRLPYIVIKIDGLGAQKNFSNNSKPADDKDIQHLARSIDRDISIAFENMDSFIKENPSCYLLYKGLDEHACKKCGCVKKNHIAVYTNGAVCCEPYVMMECEESGDCAKIKRRKNKIRVA